MSSAALIPAQPGRIADEPTAPLVCTGPGKAHPDAHDARPVGSSLGQHPVRAGRPRPPWRPRRHSARPRARAAPRRARCGPGRPRPRPGGACRGRCPPPVRRWDRARSGSAAGRRCVRGRGRWPRGPPRAPRPEARPRCSTRSSATARCAGRSRLGSIFRRRSWPSPREPGWTCAGSPANHSSPPRARFSPGASEVCQEPDGTFAEKVLGLSIRGVILRPRRLRRPVPHREPTALGSAHSLVACQRATQTAFVTGGSGFIGGHLIRRLVADGRRVRALARSERSADAVAAPRRRAGQRRPGRRGGDGARSRRRLGGLSPRGTPRHLGRPGGLRARQRDRHEERAGRGRARRRRALRARRNRGLPDGRAIRS